MQPYEVRVAEQISVYEVLADSEAEAILAVECGHGTFVESQKAFWSLCADRLVKD